MKVTVVHLVSGSRIEIVGDLESVDARVRGHHPGFLQFKRLAGWDRERGEWKQGWCVIHTPQIACMFEEEK